MKTPTVEMLERMAYKLRLVPDSEVVPVQVLQVLKLHFEAAVEVALAAGPDPASPMTTPEIRHAWRSEQDAHRSWASFDWYTAGVRAAERHHLQRDAHA